MAETEKERPVSEVLDKVLRQEMDISASDLAGLTGIGAVDLGRLKDGWKKAAVERRLRIISSLVDLSENDFSLDFSPIFNFAVGDPDETIRINAIEGLELEDKQTYIEPIIKSLMTDEAEDVRAAAADALAKYALMAETDELPERVSEKIFSALLSALENPRESAKVRRRALESISVFQQEPVDRYIEDYYYSEDPAIKASAIYAMGRNCKTTWLNFLIDEMRSGSAEFRFEAARACGEIEDEVAVPYLIELAKDSDQEVQEVAISSLGKIGGDEAKGFLQKLSRQGEHRVREAAAAALTGLLACEDPLSLNF